VDGVLTDGRLYCGPADEPQRAFHIHDGLAIEWFQRLSGPVVLITAKRSQAVQQRAEELGVRHVVQGSRDKLADILRTLATLGLTLEQAAVMGDDLPDLPAMTRCGYPLAPADAVAEVKAAARYVTERGGGHGAVREAIEHLLRASGRWDEVIRHYRDGGTTS